MTNARRGADDSGRILLLSSVFIVAACGLVYELIAGAVSSYLLGDAVTQFSLVIGVFLCAMGIGSYFSKLITKGLIKTFVEIEIWVGLAGGMASIIMFAVSALAESLFPVVFYGLCVLIGVFIGIEIPLLIRIINEKSNVSEAVSNVLALDYIGALAGSLLFPFVVLPFVGLSRSSVVFGILNLCVAAAGLRLVPKPRKWIAIRLAIVMVLLFSALVYSKRLVGFLEDMLYQDSIIYAETTPYQRIVLTRWRDDVRLYLNGHLQFCSIDEARYHECLVIPAMEALPTPENVLILGGGDGLAAREVLKYPHVEKIVVVDIDPAITTISRTRPELVDLNQGALNSDRVQIVNQDAMKYLEESREFFDVILIDLPDPNTDTLAKLYSTAFYTLCARRLNLNGVMTTQATSPFYAPDAFWCIERTMSASGGIEGGASSLITAPYHVNVPSFGEWGFVMASRREIRTSILKPSVPTRYLNPEAMNALFEFGKDMEPRPGLLINRLDDPILFRYYQRGWSRYNN